MTTTHTVSIGPSQALEARTSTRVLIVTTVARTVRAFLRPHIAHLRRLGWQVSIAANNGERDLDGENGELRDLPFSQSPVRILNHLASAYALRRQLRRSPPDLIYVHTPIASAIVRVVVASLRASRRPRVVYFVHGFHFLGKSERDLVGWLWYGVERLLCRWTDAMIVINRDDRESIRDWPIAHRGDVHLLPGVGFDPAHYVIPRNDRRTGARENVGRTPRVLSISGTTRNKRHALLLSAIARTDARLLLVGRGTNSARLKALVDRLGLSGRVDCVGHVDDVRPFIADADVTVLVSRREGLPRSLMESLAMGRPIVVTRTRGSRDLAAAVGCPIAEPTPDAVAAAVRQGLEDPRPPAEIRAQFLTAWSDGTTEAITNRLAQILETVARRT